jgi:hypothetical protein
MNFRDFLMAPLQGKTSLNKVFWLYGVVGSLLYGAIELFLDAGNAMVMRLYAIGGYLISVYVIVATFRCARNCRSMFWARMAQISAVLSLMLLPVFAYLEFTGALGLALLGEQ